MVMGTKSDVLLLLGILMLGMALGALLTLIRQKAITAKVIQELEARFGIQKGMPHEGRKDVDEAGRSITLLGTLHKLLSLFTHPRNHLCDRGGETVFISAPPRQRWWLRPWVRRSPEYFVRP